MEESYPLSPLQHGMLFQSLYERHPGVDLVQVCCEMHEALDVARFREAWQATVARHDILRSSIHYDNPDQPLQAVHDAVALPFEVHDWRGGKSRAREKKWEEFLHHDRMRGFDFSKSPLVRLNVFRIGWRRWRVCLTFHHILLDGTALYLVLDEVFARSDSTAAPTAVAPRYRDYIEWHQCQDWTAAESFWRQQLRGFTRTTPLVRAAPAAAPDPDRNAFAELLVKLSRHATADLDRLGEGAGVTVNTVLQAAWALLLSRQTQTDDIVFGATRICRKSNVPDSQRTVGLFVNTLPLRVRVHGDAPLTAWLRELRERWMAMRDFENTPLVLVQSWSEAPRGARLFETILNYQQPSWDNALLSRGGHWRRRQFSIRGQAGYAVTLDVYGGARELALKLLYDPRRMDEATARRLMGHYQTLLDSMCANPSGRVADVTTITPNEKREVTVGWNRTAVKYPRDRCIHQLFEQQVRSTPDAIALSFKDTSLTYQELERRANRIARWLREHGVRRGVMVGLCLERSVDLIAGMLGTLKAGGVHVSLDPEFPVLRMAHLLQDTGARIVLTHETIRSRLPETDAQIVCLDSERPSIRAQSSDPLSCEVSAEDLACIFHTSGSTGAPKGVCVPHRAIVRLVKNTDYASLGPSETFLQFAPVSFDAASFEIWGPLLNGGRLVVYPPGIPSLAELGAFIERENITTLWLTTGLFAEMVEHQPAKLQKVRQLLTGGSVMPPASMARALQELPHCRIIHCYGPTENTTFTTAFEVTSSPALRVPVPVGRPIANTRVYVLDANLQPVPVGVPGELYAGGDGLAQGYLNAPELTAEKFVRDPFSKDAQAKLYRTGDIARWLADGNLEFIGRIDHQVKIRGFRVEPGEIEQTVCRHPGVAKAVVRALDDVVGNKSLHAWYEPSPAAASGSPDLLSFLRARLPSFMLPVTIQRVETFPLMANGKIDTTSLPTPRPSVVADGEAAATTTSQEIVHGLFCTTLRIEGVGVHDDFFEIGGHSLKAMQLVAALSASFGISVPVRTLFASPTVESLAEWIDAALRAKRGDDHNPHTRSLVPVRPGGSRPPLFLIPGGWGGDNEMLIFARLARYLSADQPFYCFNAASLQRERVPDVAEMAQRYLREVRKVNTDGPVLLAGECMAGIIAFEMSRLIEAAGGEIHLILLDAPCPGEERLRGFLQDNTSALPEYILDYYKILLKHAPGCFNRTVRIIASEFSAKMNPSLGWDETLHGNLEITVVPGDHDSYLREHVAQTGKALRDIIEVVTPTSRR